MLRIVILIVVTVLLALADGPVLQTGQTKSYNANGDVVPYGSIKDDGYYRAGRVRSYSHSGDVVIDNATGLAWQDNESIQKKWTEASGDTAAAYCSNLYLYYNNNYNLDWRLPSIEEIQTLVDYSQVIPSATEGIFQHIFWDSYYYWSSTTDAYYTGSAWIVYFYNGYSYYNSKTYNNYVRCVRGGQLTPSNLSRNNMTEIVTDSATGLQWQDNAIVKSTERSWIDAINYCENTLILGGYSDWRLPNANELLSIADYSRSEPAINNSVFVNTSSTFSNYYWSSTTYANGTDSAWYVYFNYGSSNYYYKTGNYYVRCVRGGQLGHLVNPSIIMYLLN